MFSRFLKYCSVTAGAIYAMGFGNAAICAPQDAGDMQVNEMMALISNVGCNVQFEGIKNLSGRSNIMSQDPDYVSYRGSALQEMLNGRYANHKVPERDLIFLFAFEPITQVSSLFPSRDRPSTAFELTKGLSYKMGALAEGQKFTKSNSDTAKLVRAASKFKQCMVDSLAVPTFGQYRSDFRQAVANAGCNSDLEGVMRGVKPEYHDVYEDYYAIQMKLNLRAHDVPPEFHRHGGNLLQLVDQAFVSGMTVQRLQEQKKGATLSLNFDDRALVKAKAMSAKAAFWACMSVPQSLKNNPGATFPLFIPASTTTAGECSLNMCRFLSVNGETKVECNKTASCNARRPGYSMMRGRTGQKGPEHSCPEAYNLNQGQLDAYFESDGYTELVCSPYKDSN